MKRLKKFEELDYATYLSAADKFSKYGQEAKAQDTIRHAKEMARKYANEQTFGILVGEVKPFPDAKFSELSVFKTAGSWTIRGIFQSGSATHRIDADVSPTGQINWKDGNKFLDRGSVMKFQRVISDLSRTQGDFEDFFTHTGLKSEDLKVVLRTFYF